MIRKRKIPVLLIKGSGLYKGIEFKNHKYIGDPMNTVKIFTEKKVDELIFLDINSTIESKEINYNFIKKIANECYVPFAVGGGINSLNQIRKILSLGAEKVVINSSIADNPNLITEAANFFGSQSIVVSIDISKNWFGKYSTYFACGSRKSKYHPSEFAKMVEGLGAGEIMINCIHKDGKMEGYDDYLIKEVSSVVNIPVIASGGAGTYQDLDDILSNETVSAAAAGSLFVFHGKHRAVLVNYPE